MEPSRGGGVAHTAQQRYHCALCTGVSGPTVGAMTPLTTAIRSLQPQSALPAILGSAAVCGAQSTWQRTRVS